MTAVTRDNNNNTFDSYRALSGSHLVQQNYLRGFEDGPGDGHPLLLPPAQLQPPLAHLGVVAYQRAGNRSSIPYMGAPRLAVFFVLDTRSPGAVETT